MFKKIPDFKPVDPVKFMYNIGCLIDLTTGSYAKGIHGENILNGGLGVITGIAGRGNSFKSTIIHYMILSAASKVCASKHKTFISTYDTEINISLSRLSELAHPFLENFNSTDIIEEGLWQITDKTKHSGNEWYKKLKDFLKEDKMKDKDYIVKTPFVDKDGKYLSTIFPSFGEIDSISEFDVEATEEIQDKNELGDSGGNTLYMKLGLIKNRFMMELPYLFNSSAHYLAMTAHVGDDMAIGAGPYAGPVKKLQHLKHGEKIKGISDKFLFLTNTFWQVVNSSLLINQNTKGPEYPYDRNNPEEGSSDLNIVTIKSLRNKSGLSGGMISIIVSQREGVLPSLTEFHYIKENDRYGLNGNNVNYELDLLPGVKLGRTTVRQLLRENKQLQRAVKITADMHQIEKYKKCGDLKVPTPKELYEKLSKKYDWNVLLNTRDWWTFNNDELETPFLSTADLIEMYYDLYTPYWLKKK